MYWDDKYGTHSVSPDVSAMDVIKISILVSVSRKNLATYSKFCNVGNSKYEGNNE